MSIAGISSVFGGVAKLKIAAYPTSQANPAEQIGGIEVPYNPASIELGHAIDYAQNVFFNERQHSMRFQRVRPSSLKLELLFDATLPGNEAPVDSQIDTLRAICMRVDSKSPAGHYLQIMWGQMQWSGKNYFIGRASAMSVRYTLFDGNGTPLRASVHLTIDADLSMSEELARGGTLPKVAMRATPSASLPDLLYGTALASVAAAGAGVMIDYIGAAYDNDMDALDDFEPGDLLYVPWQ